MKWTWIKMEGSLFAEKWITVQLIEGKKSYFRHKQPNQIIPKVYGLQVKYLRE